MNAEVNSTPENKISRLPTHVVGVGASAGGLEALERFFKGVPLDTGMAFVVVQHLSPDFKSVMDELLARWTDLPIHRVVDGMEMAANCIYLMPPRTSIKVFGNRLMLTEKAASEGLSLPIDVFFESLAEQWGENSIAIVLSGTGSDGSRGITNIHAVGGLVMSQDVSSAKFDGMPRSAEKTGVVDFSLKPEDLAETISRYSKLPLVERSQLVDKPRYVDESSINRLLRLLREEFAVDFTHYKNSTVLRRIERRVMLSQSIDFDAYIDTIEADKKELHTLYKDLLIGVTHFFRDAEAFEKIEKEVLPEVIKGLAPGDQLRVWSAACATGEEAYSLAILIYEILEDLRIPVDVKIFATDLHRGSLDHASAGVYGETSLQGISEERRKRFFLKIPRGYQVIPELRQMIVFAPHNVIEDAPFTKIDFISCRNMLIYLEQEMQARVISLFHFSLKKKGVLFLGPSETLADLQSEFDTLDGHWKLYSKRRDVRLKRELHLPMTDSAKRPSVRFESPPLTLGQMGERSLFSAYDALLETYMPSGVLLDSERQLVHVFGDPSNFLRLKPGRPSPDALDLFVPSLRAATASAIHRAAREASPVHYSGIQVKEIGKDQNVRLGVQPIMASDGEVTHFMVTLELVESRQPVESKELDAGEVSAERFSILEAELRSSRENLQATIEELETSNEELQATNEELVASNEEMQSTNEELHSVNEELYTVNAEYQNKITELTELSDDMNHLLEHLDVGLLFLDSELGIRKFTPSIASAFNLLPQDTGRKFSSFSHRLKHGDLNEDIQRVIRNQTTFEGEVQDEEGRWFVLKIRPYRSRGKIDGAVIELIDVTDVKHRNRMLKQEIQRMQDVLDQGPVIAYAKDLEGRYLMVNRQCADVIGRKREEIVGKTDHDILAKDIADAINVTDVQSISTGKEIRIDQGLSMAESGPKLSGVKFPIRNKSGRIEGVGGCLFPAGN